MSIVLNLNSSTLNFNEPVVPSSINTTQIVLQNAPSELVFHVVLTSTSHQVEDCSTAVIVLNTRHVDMLNLIPNLATGINDTCMSFSSFTI